jgi:hypothetical protein
MLPASFCAQAGIARISKKWRDETKRKELPDLDAVMGILLELGFLQ